MTKQPITEFHIDLQTLTLFAAVAQHGSLTKASISLNSSPSSLSRKISALERMCGGRLLHRTGRGLELTELGQHILPRIKELLCGFDGLREDLHANAGVPAGDVRVGVLASLANPLINRLYHQLREEHPRVRLQVFGGSNGKLEEWLANGDVDIGVLFRYGNAHIASEQALGVVDTYLVSCLKNPVTRHATVKFSSLDKLPLVLPGPPNGLRVALDQTARKQNIELNVILEVNSVPIYTDVVAEGGIYTVLAGYAAAQGVKSGRLQASRIIEPDMTRIVCLAVSPRPASLAARETARMLRHIVADVADSIGLRVFSNPDLENDEGTLRSF